MFLHETIFIKSSIILNNDFCVLKKSLCIIYVYKGVENAKQLGRDFLASVCECVSVCSRTYDGLEWSCEKGSHVLLTAALHTCTRSATV